MTFEQIRKHPWFIPVTLSLALHILLLAALYFIPVRTNPLAEEHQTRKFRLKGVEHLPTIAGKSGGGDRFGNTSSLQFVNKNKANPLRSVKDVSMQSLVSHSTSLNQNSLETTPRKIEMENASLTNTRDFETVLSQTHERQLKDKVQSKQQSTAGSSLVKILSHRTDQESLLQFLSKPLAGLNLQATQNVGIDPDEGMPGFTPMSSGGGGGGGTGSGSPGGFADGIDNGVAESKLDIAKYGALDDFMDIQVFTYQDPLDSQKYFMIKILAKKDTKVFHVMPKEILFTIDCSLSIRQDRLQEVQRGIRYCLDHLNQEDLFNIVSFKDNTTFFSKESVQATPENIKKAERFVSGLTSNQQTDVYSAFKSIVESPLKRVPSNVILISDGRPTSGMVDSRELINAVTRINKKARPIFAFSGGGKVNRYLLDFIAYQNRAWSQYIKRTSGINKGLATFYDKIKDPLFLNLRYHLNNLDEKEVFPKSLPDFYKNAEFILYGTYQNEVSFSMQLLGDVDGKTKELVFTRSLKDAAQGNVELMKGYAFNKIYYLISRLTSGGNNPQILQEITALSQRYGITTPYSPEIQKKS